MNKHCKGCVHHHNAEHKTKALKHYDDWCVKYSRYAPSAVGMCKLNNGKKTAQQGEKANENGTEHN